MKIFEDEIKRRYEEKRNAKTSFWSNWIIKVVLILALILLIRYSGNLMEIFHQDSSENQSEQIIR